MHISSTIGIGCSFILTTVRVTTVRVVCRAPSEMVEYPEGVTVVPDPLPLKNHKNKGVS